MLGNRLWATFSLLYRLNTFVIHICEFGLSKSCLQCFRANFCCVFKSAIFLNVRGTISICIFCRMVCKSAGMPFVLMTGEIFYNKFLVFLFGLCCLKIIDLLNEGYVLYDYFVACFCIVWQCWFTIRQEMFSFLYASFVLVNYLSCYSYMLHVALCVIVHD